MHTFHLTHNWQFKPRQGNLPLERDFTTIDGWLPASVPGTVHLDLMANGKIPDPFFNMNEKAVQWVGEQDWLYRCTFDLPEEFTSEQVDLCFDGLDTFATVRLNGEKILSSQNMFTPQRVSVKSHLVAGQNTLGVLFESAWRYGKEYQAAHGEMKVWNTDASRVYVRKMQCQYGWDWGPMLLTAGIWRSVRLESYSARIVDIYCPVQVADDLSSAKISMYIQLQAARRKDLSLELTLVDPDGQLVDVVRKPAQFHPEFQHTFTIQSPRLWWPRGYGDQPLYRLKTILRHAEQIIHEREQRIGLRNLRLVQEPLPDETGTTFYFEVNNTPIFCGGVNWIPADTFIPRLKVDDYRAWLEMAANANMNMLRVWGGGIYEEDCFYDICDELGLMVWQDFMFACGIYPTPEWFLNNVRTEAVENVRRLRNHPCLALWCGNNEDYWIARSFNLYDPEFNGNFNDTGFPAREIYERLLPSVCETLDPTRPYWRGSPYNGTTGKDDLIRGDNHSWKVWFDMLTSHHDYTQTGGRFISEFGMQAYPARATLESFSSTRELMPHNQTLEFHDKSPGAPQRLAAYLAANVPLPSADLDQYIYATQFVQAETLAEAYRVWRRNWGGPRHYSTSGALVWQLNDCWPAISWSIADYYRRPKPAYYIIRRALSQVVVELALTGSGVAVWGVNNTLHDFEATLEVRSFSLEGKRVFYEKRTVHLPPNQCTELGIFVYPDIPNTVIGARLLQSETVICRGSIWPEPFKHHSYRDPGIKTTRTSDQSFSIQSLRPAKGVWFWSEGEVGWSDNMIDIMPDESQEITATGKIDHLYFRDLSCLFKQNA